MDDRYASDIAGNGGYRISWSRDIVPGPVQAIDPLESKTQKKKI